MKTRNGSILRYRNSAFLLMEEFPLACGEGELVEQIKACFQNDAPMPAVLHDAALSYYRQYLVVGGMPDCVGKYLQTKDFILVRHTQDMILASYLNDMSKYNSQNEIKKKPEYAIKLSTKNFDFEDGKKTVPLYAAFCI